MVPGSRSIKYNPESGIYRLFDSGKFYFTFNLKIQEYRNSSFLPLTDLQWEEYYCHGYRPPGHST